MNKILFVFLTLLVIAVVAVAGKIWMDSASRPPPVAPLAPEHLVEAPQKDGSSRPAPAGRDGFAPMAGSSLEAPPQDENQETSAKPQAEAPTDEKREMQKSLWAGAWGRQIPDPDIIDMDLSQVGKPGGKAVPFTYVEPPPLPSGSYVTNADGTQSMVLGNTIVNADGSKATIDGHQILKSDGTLGVMVGNDILWSDGSKSTR